MAYHFLFQPIDLLDETFLHSMGEMVLPVLLQSIGAAAQVVAGADFSEGFLFEFAEALCERQIFISLVEQQLFQFVDTGIVGSA